MRKIKKSHKLIIKEKCRTTKENFEIKFCNKLEMLMKNKELL